MKAIIKPCTLPVALTAIPTWVGWRWMKRDGRLTKVPYDPHTGRMAKSNDPATWGTYEEATAADNRYSWDGVGFVVQKSHRITGVDLDHCIVNGEVELWARFIVKMLDSYTEITPSGTGLRVYVLGNLPEGGRKCGNVEMYDDLRFFTVTGDHLDGTKTTVEERESVLHDLHRATFPPVAMHAPTPARIIDPDDHTLLERAKNAKFSGSKFSALWDGAYQVVNPRWSQSEADLSLCRLLGFWTKNDPARVDALFRLSGLFREKWDKRCRSDGSTYGELTIRKALG